MVRSYSQGVPPKKSGVALSPSKRVARSNRLNHLSDEPKTKVLIIGGGINGLSTLRELALQGVEVTLIDKGDFAAGATAASSHMVHGGVRYLENGEFRLVKESLQERNRLLNNAPHCVTPLKTTIPIFSVFSGVLSAPLRFLTHKPGKPKERGALLIKLGLMLYDTFGRDGGTLPRHKFWGKKKTLRNFPDMNPAVKYSATYYDACMESPERLSLEVLADTLDLPNVRVANYCSVVGAEGNQLKLHDEISGGDFDFEADLVVNATGPWTDLTNELLGTPTSYMGGTKGSHIVVENDRLLRACDGREIFFENSDGRIVLMFPLMGKVLIGTTDIPVDMREPVYCTEEEVDYFIELVKLVYPDIEVDRSQIVFKYSGVRPLPAADDLNPGFVSRDYTIQHTRSLADGEFGLISLVGGKWTTFRALGAHLADEVLSSLGLTRVVSTEKMPIGGGKDFPRSEEEKMQWANRNAPDVDSQRVIQLLNRYGTRCMPILQVIAEQGEKFLQEAPEYSDAEIRHIIRTEYVTSIEDILLRRTTIGFIGDTSERLLDELGELLNEELGISDKELNSQKSSITLDYGKVG